MKLSFSSVTVAVTTISVLLVSIFPMGVQAAELTMPDIMNLDVNSLRSSTAESSKNKKAEVAERLSRIRRFRQRQQEQRSNGGRLRPRQGGFFANLFSGNGLFGGGGLLRRPCERARGDSCVCTETALRRRIENDVGEIQICKEEPLTITEAIDITDKSFKLSCSSEDEDETCAVLGGPDGNQFLVGAPSGDVEISNLYLLFFGSTASDIDGGVMSITGGDGSLTVRNTLFSDCSASNGGAIYVQNSALTIEGILFTDCRAAANGGVIYLQDSELMADGFTSIYTNATTDGGSIYATGSSTNVTVKSSSMIVSDAGSTGGGISLIGGASLTLLNVDFLDCDAPGNGGGIYSESSTVTVGNFTLFEDCAGANGGGIYIQDSVLNVDEAYFEGNSAENGGSVYLQNTEFLCNNYYTLFDQASINGGSIYATGSSSSITQDSGAFFYASADNNGGAIYLSDGASYLGSRMLIEKCSADIDGGAIYSDSATIDLGGDIFIIKQNEAERNGGGIYVKNTKMSLNWTLFDLNNAGGTEQDGDSIYIADDDDPASTGSFVDCVDFDTSGATRVFFCDADTNDIVQVGTAAFNNTNCFGRAQASSPACTTQQ